MEPDNNFSDGDEEHFDEKHHENFIKQIKALEKSQALSKPARTEAALQVSEFSLTKPDGAKKKVSVLNLLRTLKDGTKEARVKDKVKQLEKKSFTLQKPLEKIHADKLRRKTTFKKTKKELGKWDPVVEKNRADTQLYFPLQVPSAVNIENGNDTKMYALKSDIELEFEKLANKPMIESIAGDKEKYKLSLEEIIRKRREQTRLKITKSYEAAKKARQKRIKSKTYHRILRKGERKKQLREFELLQKTNPEAALEKLEEIEKARALERGSLRHKSTGKWAKNKEIRAKYDKESRQALAEQLAISRDLTRNINANESSDSEGGEDGTESAAVQVPADNPWLGGVEADSAVSEFVSGYRKFWLEQKNKPADAPKAAEPRAESDCDLPHRSEEKEDLVEQNGNGVQSECSDAEEDTQVQCSENDENIVETSVNNLQESQNGQEEVAPKINPQKRKHSETKKATKTKQIKNTKARTQERKRNASNRNSDGKIRFVFHVKENEVDKAVKLAKWKLKKMIAEERTVPINENEPGRYVKLVKKLNDRKNGKMRLKVNDKDLDSPDKVESIFDNLEAISRTRSNDVKPKANKKKDAKRKQKKKPVEEVEEENLLRFNEQASKPVLDEELTYNDDDYEGDDRAARLRKIINSKTEESESTKDVDPHKFVQIKPKTLETTLPDLEQLDDDNSSEDESNQKMIAEAFEDDDLAISFRKEKKQEIENDKPKPIDLTLPGWGSWGGKDIKISKRKRKRFIIKPPLNLPSRKDKHKDNLIINEHIDEDLKKHMVSEVPYPFKEAGAFEKTIKNPIGNTFLTETSHMRLIQPSVETRKGTIINPMDESELLKKPYQKIRVKK